MHRDYGKIKILAPTVRLDLVHGESVEKLITSLNTVNVKKLKNLKTLH